jgi:hypothetical protein
LLGRRVNHAVQPGDIVTTLSQGQPSIIAAVGPDGIELETERSRQRGASPQHVPFWMIERVWEHLVAHGTVTLEYMLATDGLNVKRSAFVAALLARFDDVRVSSSRPVTLEYRPSVTPQA